VYNETHIQRDTAQEAKVSTRPWVKASSFANAEFQRGQAGRELDLDKVTNAPVIEPYIITLGSDEDINALVFRKDGSGAPLFGWFMKGAITRAFGPIVSGGIGIWNKPMRWDRISFPANSSSAELDHGDSLAEWACQRVINDPTAEQAIYIPKDIFPDGKARMWLRNKLMGIRYSQTEGFCVNLVDNGQVRISDFVDGKPWECGEAIADWAKDHLVWIDKPKITIEQREIIAKVEADLAEDEAFGLF
jgi:hypothetical protein